MANFNAEETVDMVWCKDSETSQVYLIDRKTNMIIATKDENGNIVRL